MKSLRQTRGFSLLAVLILLAIAAALTTIVVRTGQSKVEASKRVNLEASLVRLSNDITASAQGRLNYAHIDDNGVFLVNNNLAPSDWIYDTATGEFSTDTGWRVRVDHNFPAGYLGAGEGPNDAVAIRVLGVPPGEAFYLAKNLAKQFPKTGADAPWFVNGRMVIANPESLLTGPPVNVVLMIY